VPGSAERLIQSAPLLTFNPEPIGQSRRRGRWRSYLRWSLSWIGEINVRNQRFQKTYPQCGALNHILVRYFDGATEHKSGRYQCGAEIVSEACPAIFIVDTEEAPDVREEGIS
jgi:hypothetical protein